MMKCEAEAPGAYRMDPVKIEWFKDKVPVDLSNSRLKIIDPGNRMIKLNFYHKLHVGHLTPVK